MMFIHWQKFLSHSIEVFEWCVPVNCHLFFAIAIMAPIFRFHNIAIVTMGYRVYKRECRMKFIGRFNFKNFIAEGTFN